MYMHRGIVIRNRIPQCGEVNYLWIFVFKILLNLHLVVRFPVEGSKTDNAYLFGPPEKILEWKNKIQLLQLVCEVTQIITCSHFWGFIYILNEDNTVCITVQHRLPQFTQVLLCFEPSLGR